jgi:hypothetical protein
MITIGVQAVCREDARQADFQVTITSSGGTAGIESVVVDAINKVVLAKQTPAGCPPDLQFSVNAVSFDQLPVYVEVVECQSGVDQGQAVKVKTSAGPFGRECLHIPVNCGPAGQNQNNPSCVKLQNEITAGRNQILIQCGNAATLKSQRDAALATSLSLLAASIAVGAIAFGLSTNVWTIIAAIVLFVISGALATAAMVAGASAIALTMQLGALQGLMDQERQALNDKILRLRDVCCTEFINQMLFDVPVCTV